MSLTLIKVYTSRSLLISNPLLGCFSLIWSALITVGLMPLRALQRSSYGWFQAIITLLECHVTLSQNNGGCTDNNTERQRRCPWDQNGRIHEGWRQKCAFCFQPELGKSRRNDVGGQMCFAWARKCHHLISSREPNHSLLRTMIELQDISWNL